MKAIFLLLNIVAISTMALSQNPVYTLDDIQGVWCVYNNEKNSDFPEMFDNEFYIFKGDSCLFVITHNEESSVPSTKKRVSVYKYGFTDECWPADIKKISNSGHYLTIVDEDGYNWVRCEFELYSGEYMLFYNNECCPMTGLPKEVQITLFKYSMMDHRNYTREFLDHDICKIKANNVQLLDSLQNPIGVNIPKDDVVEVYDAIGDLVRVVYDVANESYRGYLKREDLQFVETKK